MVENENVSCKVVLIGESSVGKTSIITRFIKKTFENNPIPSLGVDLFRTNLKIGYNIVRFKVWDTAGQEKYRSMSKGFYKNASAVVLVYDITQEKTFQEIQTYWFKQIIENSPKDIITVIVANKSDLYEDEQVDEGEAINFAKSRGAMFKRTSALNSNGIENIFIEIGKEFLKRKAMPSSSKKNKDTIRITSDSKNNEKNEKKKCIDISCSNFFKQLFVSNKSKKNNPY